MADAKLVDLVQDFNLYPRNDVSSTHVTALCDAITLGDPLPPIVVDKKSKRIVDGFHRYSAYKRLDIETVPVVYREYKTEADLFADAVRLNNAHGRAFDPYDRKRAIVKLQEFGMTAKDIGDIVRMPMARIAELGEDFAKTRGGATVVVKAGLVKELAGKTITRPQVDANERWSGYHPTYHVNQLIAILEAGICPQVPTFHEAMDRLVSLWKTAAVKTA